MLGRLISSKTVLLLFSIALSSAGLAQKPEDYPDYRTKKESFSKLSDKALRADLGSFSIGGIEESLNKKPLKKISPTTYRENFIQFKSDEVEVSVTLEPFKEEGKKFQKMDDHILKINGKPYYGCYWKLPETAIKSVLVKLGKDTIVIPPQAYADLYDMHFSYRDKAGTERTANGVFFSADGSNMYIYLLSRDPKESYEVTWIIQNKQYLRRVMDWGF